MSDNSKEKLKRENKRFNDKKKKPLYTNHKPIVIEERTFKGFTLQLVQNSEKTFKVTSPFFKEGYFATRRRTEESAFFQGMYLVHSVYNYEDIRDIALNEEGLAFLKTSDFSTCLKCLRLEKCVCLEET